MIINVLAAKNSQGYIKTEKGYGFFGHFFPTANFATRKSTIEKIGGFDVNCRTGEDLDICIRITENDFDLFYQETALVYHYERNDVFKFYKQFYNYAFYHPYLFRKHMLKKNRIICYYAGMNPDPSRSISDIRIFNLPFICSGMIYLSPFIVANILMITSFILMFFSPAFSLGILLLALSFYWAHFKNAVNVKHPFAMIRFILFKYTLDSVYILAGLLGGIKEKLLYLGPPTFVGHKINYNILKEITIEKPSESRVVN